MTISLPEGIWNTEPKPTSKDFPGKLVKSINVVGNDVRLVTQTNGFGFIKVPVPGKPQFVVQLYRDPIGARWKPAQAPSPASPATPAQTLPETQTQPLNQRPAQQATVQPEAVPTPQAVLNGQSEADLPTENTEDRKPFFAVPYSVRNEVAPPGEAVQVQGQSVPLESRPIPREDTAPLVSEAESGNYPPANELRFKAVNKTAEEVKFAELAGDGAGGAPVVGQVTQSVAEPVAPSETSSESGSVTGTVAVPPTNDNLPAETRMSVQSPVELSGAGTAGGTVAPPPGSQSAAQGAMPVVQEPGSVVGSVVQQPGVGDGSGLGQAGGSVAPPPTVVQGAPPPEPTPEESKQVMQAVQPPELSVQEQMAREEGIALPESESPDGQVAEGQEATAPAVDNATQAREDALRNQLYEAQNLMFSGALEKALPMFEDILKQPQIPADVREETQYAIADIKRQIHSKEIPDYFNEISQAYIEAMNSNLRSNRVPRALVNLGLINLQVGNFPEAKAYFKMLQDKYPDDDTIPSISYYWGEYYYKKGDYKKAADQFQYLIQTYPEHELVKDAAYYLADSLNKTGFIEQAFQIVDYIDKRWPDYYMENPQFLRLAGGVEMKLKKWPQAKNHYFTYYNLNPEAEGADIVLARIGDIYVRENERKAAKMIYQKVVQDHADQEGALVAKMRLAEEGIYDEPAMSDMVSVFDRPYNKRPENIYKEILEKHPDSPLAPIAQLKLAMWHAFQKQYPEALAAAQDMIEKYPDSPLVDRARKLGDSVFALAVPGMVAEQRYGRVVRYWETYDFIGKKDTKVDDWTKLNVATSYWKVGQPAKALELIQPYLKQRQVPDVSDEALGLAMNIYLDQLAWKEIADLADMTKKNWKIKPKQQRQLDYARAMALQNLGEDNKALAMWAELAKDQNVDPAFRAYAMYYMAKGAMEKQDLRKVFVYAQEALSLLLKTRGDPEKIKDAVLMSIYATERSGRYGEALKWAKEYDQYIDVENPEWASTRFKLARIYRKAGAIEEWKQLLGDIVEKKPDSLQAKLAKSALDTYDLEQKVQEYAPAPQ